MHILILILFLVKSVSNVMGRFTGPPLGQYCEIFLKTVPNSTIILPSHQISSSIDNIHYENFLHKIAEVYPNSVEVDGDITLEIEVTEDGFESTINGEALTSCLHRVSI